MRGFKIDVETDSLVEADQDAEKQRRIELVTAVGEYLGKVGPLGVQMPELSPLIGGMLQFAVRGFKVGSELEDLIEKTMDDIHAKLANPQPPQPDPETMAKLEGEKIKAEAAMQKAALEAQQSQADHQAKMVELENSMQMEREKHALEMERLQLQMAHEREKFQIDMQRSDQQFSADMESKHFDRETKEREAQRSAEDESGKESAAEEKSETASVLKELVAKLSAKRRLVRGVDNSPIGVEDEDGNFREFTRGADGQIEGLD